MFFEFQLSAPLFTRIVRNRQARRRSLSIWSRWRTSRPAARTHAAVPLADDPPGLRRCRSRPPTRPRGGGPLTLSDKLAHLDLGLLGLALTPAQRDEVTHAVASVQPPATTARARAPPRARVPARDDGRALHRVPGVDRWRLGT